ncbi:MAG: hypothetical protein K6F53_05675 [Lachnospiraceae bacterium]|nr:hypothetical protein [Lachnospiraceae bacterium]
MSEMKQNSTDSIFKQIPKICGIVIFAIAALFLSILLGTSASLTSYIAGDGSEKIFFVRDYPWLKLPVIFIVLAGLFFLHRTLAWERFKKKIEKDRFFYATKWILTGGILVISLIWVLSTQTTQFADQESVLIAVRHLFSSDYHDFFRDQYIGICTNQLGLVFWEYLFMKLTGTQNIQAFQILNAFFASVIFLELAEIGGEFGLSRLSQLVILFTGYLFWPVGIYASFVYGTLPGLAFSLIAICGMIRYVNGGKWYLAAASGLCWIPAVMVKENYIIFLIGAVAWCIVEIFRRKAFVKYWYPALFVLLCVLSLTFPRSFIEKKTGVGMDGGITPLAYVAMGLSENGSKANGWYNSYVRDSYCSLGYDTAAQKEDAKRRLTEIGKRFSEDTVFRNAFFLQKTVSQWDEPTFQSFWIYQTRGNNGVLPKWAGRLKNDAVIDPLRTWLDFFMVFVYAGACLHVLFCPAKKAFRTSVFLIIFIGGFLFHLVWEAKAQYTLPYFLLLIPYAVMGLLAALDRLNRLFSAGAEKKPEKKKTKKKESFRLEHSSLVSAGAILLGLVLIIYLQSTESRIVTKEDTEAVKEHLAQEREELMQDVSDGEYLIREVGEGAVLYVGDEYAGEKPEETFYFVGFDKDGENSPGSRLTIRTFNGVSRIFHDNEEKNEERYRVLESFDREGAEHRMIRAARMSARREQELRIEKQENGYYTIRQDNEHVLTFDPENGELYLMPFDEAFHQFFELVPLNRDRS